MGLFFKKKKKEESKSLPLPDFPKLSDVDFLVFGLEKWLELKKALDQTFCRQLKIENEYYRFKAKSRFNDPSMTDERLTSPFSSPTRNLAMSSMGDWVADNPILTRSPFIMC